ncbi:MAG: hypothetical protein AAFS03_04920 [Pseudomonadota bacterium]
MRGVFACVLCLSIVGCATVSMTPGRAIVENGVSEQQSALRTASNAFCDEAEKAGWVRESSGLVGLASILLNGARGEDAPRNDYAAAIEADAAPVDVVFATIIRDATAARSGLSAVVLEADRVLEEAAEAKRADVMSFERVLVNAQAASRNFARAADIAGQRAKTPDAVDVALDALDTEIDTARGTADTLADTYASINRSTS